jgi:hypothetical protein
MADLPPLAVHPTAGVSPELVGQLEHSANWARTFGGANTTNIAQRYRHNQDVEAYAGALQQQRRQAQEEALLTDKRAQDLYFGMRRLDLQEEEARTRMQHNAELHPLKIQVQKTQIAADLARERAVTNAAEVKSKTFLQEQEDDDAFHTALNRGLSQGIKIGTPEWAELVAGARLSAPAMKSEIFDDVWKATSRSPLTPQEAIDQAVAKKKALMDVQPAKPTKADSYTAFNKELSEMVTAFGGQDKVPAEKWAEFEARKAKIGAVTPIAEPAATTAQERIATNPTTGEKLALRNGKWVPLK